MAHLVAIDLILVNTIEGRWVVASGVSFITRLFWCLNLRNSRYFTLKNSENWNLILPWFVLAARLCWPLVPSWWILLFFLPFVSHKDFAPLWFLLASYVYFVHFLKIWWQYFNFVYIFTFFQLVFLRQRSVTGYVVFYAKSWAALFCAWHFGGFVDNFLRLKNYWFKAP